MSVVKEYGAMIAADPAAQAMGRNGTAQVSDLTNHLGGLPVNNFSSGQQVDTANEVHKMGGDYIRDLNIERGGETTHACMPGCMIKCSNIYVDAAGNEIVSPLEYETICLLGTNVGIREPDDVARLNETLNDLGVDTIEVGATLGVLMEAGEAEFGDLAYMEAALVDIAEGTERGKLLAQGEGEGAAAVGFLDAAGERAFAADGNAVGVGKICPGEGSGGKYQRVFR